VVQDVRDVMAIENTRQYKGLYHVLNGIINPMEGIGPEDLTISGLLARVKDEAVKEVIFALPASIEGETTAYYLFKLLHIYSVKVSVIARGVAVGDDLEYADEVTLGRSILNRLPYEK
jgi:recombination protein RecR